MLNFRGKNLYNIVIRKTVFESCIPTKEGKGRDGALFDPAHQKHMGQNPTSLASSV